MTAHGAAAAPEVVGGHTARVLAPGIDAALVAAMRAAACKAVWRDDAGAHREARLPDGETGAALAVTRCYMNLEQYDPALPSLLRPAHLAAEAVDRVNAYVSPPGCGTPLHFDLRTVWIVQLFGEKTWRVAAGRDPHGTRKGISEWTLILRGSAPPCAWWNAGRRAGRAARPWPIS